MTVMACLGDSCVPGLCGWDGPVDVIHGDVPEPVVSVDGSVVAVSTERYDEVTPDRTAVVASDTYAALTVNAGAARMTAEQLAAHIDHCITVLNGLRAT